MNVAMKRHRNTQWTIRRPLSAGRFTTPQRIFVCKANHWGNSLCHVAQTKGGAIKDGGLLTVATCELAMRRRVAKFCRVAEYNFEDLGAQGVYVLIAGAARPGKNSGITPGDHSWVREVAGRPLCVLRVTQLVAPAEAARRCPGRADVNRVRATAELSSNSRHDRFASARRLTRVGAPVIFSTAFRRFIAPPETDLLPDSIGTPLKALTFPDALEISPDDPEWSDAAAAVHDTWVRWQSVSGGW